MFYLPENTEPAEAVIVRERALNAEYGPIAPSFWFMYDNHRFAKLTGSAEEMGRQALRHMEEDKFCGTVFVRERRDGKELRAFCVNGNYRNPGETRERIREWVKNVGALLGETV